MYVCMYVCMYVYEKWQDRLWAIWLTFLTLLSVDRREFVWEVRVYKHYCFIDFKTVFYMVPRVVPCPYAGICYWCPRVCTTHLRVYVSYVDTRIFRSCWLKSLHATSIWLSHVWFVWVRCPFPHTWSNHDWRKGNIVYGLHQGQDWWKSMIVVIWLTKISIKFEEFGWYRLVGGLLLSSYYPLKTHRCKWLLALVSFVYNKRDSVEQYI